MTQIKQSVLLLLLSLIIVPLLACSSFLPGNEPPPPPQESAEYCRALNGAGLDTVFLVTPSTADERLPLVRQATSGFCYYVSRTGVTGAKQDLSASLARELAHVKKHISAPIFVGFGIRTPEHVRTVGKIADGVIVGSAFVDRIERAGSEAEAKEQVVELAVSLRRALDEEDTGSLSGSTYPAATS